jgi:hypothetical protein
VRTRAEFTRFFDGLDLVDPGVTSVHRWRPDTDAATDITDAQVSVYGPSPAHTDALRGVAAQHAIRGFRVLPVSYPSPSSPAPGCASGPTAAPDTVNLTDYGGLRPADLLRKAGGTPNPPQGNQTHLETDP